MNILFCHKQTSMQNNAHSENNVDNNVSNLLATVALQPPVTTNPKIPSKNSQNVCRQKH